MKRYKITPTNADRDLLILSKTNDLGQKGTILLTFGQHSVKVKIQNSDELNTDEIHLSKPIISKLKIPLFCEYELIIQPNGISIGPYIGILASLTTEGLSRRLKDLKSYVKSYHEIGGVITAFSLDQINHDQANITQGYFYNPLLRDWLPMDDIPFPSSLFNKCKVNKDNNWKLLSSIYQSNIFNYPTFHKWEMYNWLSKDPTCKNFLPATQICKQPQDILDFLKIYQHAFLKPVGGTFARGILFLSYDKNHIDLYYERKRKRYKQTFQSKTDFSSFLKRFLGTKNYLIQQAIPLLASNNRIIDFRLIYIKNKYGMWENGGLFARYGKIGSVVSNLTSGGKPKDGMEALKELIPAEQVTILYKEMQAISKKVSSILENHLVQCGNLGFDFGIDTNYKLWIIEINNEDPDHRIATVCKRKDILYYVRLQNMLYAKKLAGFETKETPPES